MVEATPCADCLGWLVFACVCGTLARRSLVYISAFLQPGTLVPLVNMETTPKFIILLIMGLLGMLRADCTV